MADKLCLETGYDNEKVIEMLNDLSPVTPKEKTGKWETTTIIFRGRTFVVIECSCCKEKQQLFAKTNFCPNCGAKMAEPQKSEG